MTTATDYPTAASAWVDKRDDRRRLIVAEIEPGDRLGREVRGTVTCSDGSERDYATDHRTFCAVWRPA